MIVWELPPKAFSKILVKAEFLYGTKLFFPSEFYAKTEITWPKVVRLWLMPTASLSLWPVAPVLSCLSLPAKSTKLIIETFYVFLSPTFWICLNWTVMMVWALELVAFIWVAAMVRFLNSQKNLLWSLVHDSFNLFVASDQMFLCTVDINTEKLVFSDLKSSSGSGVCGDGQVLNFFVVDF